MTTIAWDGKTIAADRMGVREGLKSAVTKILRLETGEVIAVSGSLEHLYSLKRWYEAGADPEKFPAHQRDKEEFSSFIMVKHGQAYSYHTCPDAVPEGCPNAWGSGRDFALSAMAFGKNAVEAVEFAAQFNTGTGFGVDSFNVGPALVRVA